MSSYQQVRVYHEDEQDEIELRNVNNEDEQDEKVQGSLGRWEDPWILLVTITLVLMTPSFFFGVILLYQLTGRMHPSLFISLHQTLALWIAYYRIPQQDNKTPTSGTRTCFRFLVFCASGLDFVLLVLVYPFLIHLLIEYLWTDEDGTTIIEWSRFIHQFHTLKYIGWGVVLFRCLIGGAAVGIRIAKRYNPAYGVWRPTFWLPCNSTTRDPVLVQSHYRRILTWSIRASLFLNFVGFLSAWSHFGPWPMPLQHYKDCDPLDPTECVLPFPSFHHVVNDETTATGWRVNLKGHILPPLRGGLQLHPGFLNELDGFSTMAPLLFYIDGLKEAHEQGANIVQLRGPEQIELSVTRESITLLLDVEAQELVYHSAEIDYLDPIRPLVMVFPSRPLKHNTHYALAVINAADTEGHRLSPTDGMQQIFHSSNSAQRTRFREVVIPALETAAPWWSFAKDPQSLQLLFDFPTISENSQLGPIRGVRDAAIAHIQKWDWSDHARVIKVEEYDCDVDLIARTIHGELDVPWFLDSFGAGGRSAFLDRDAVESGTPVTIGQAKFIVRVPCSVKKAALGQNGGKPLRAIMEFGHGLFGNRGEVKEGFLSRMAHDNGYILTAMDWRGMSSYDLPVVIKTLIGTPRLFQAVRDNLIQGYANKFALQHFSQNGMLEMRWLEFEGSRLPSFESRPPVSVFYGISQGGILGAGYTSLSGATGLIHRGILGSPGSPFALVLSRSLDFSSYDVLLLMNFYTNRHVRILLGLVQMGWDSTEASGVLALPVSEPIPRILIQAGLGDPVVPTIAAEALARAFDASILPGNPRTIFGVPTLQAANETWDGPHVTLTELLYEKEFNSLPLDDVVAAPNSVHYCVRLDNKLIKQIAEFVNSGRVIDPCVEGQCRRSSAIC